MWLGGRRRTLPPPFLALAFVACVIVISGLCFWLLNGLLPNRPTAPPPSRHDHRPHRPLRQQHKHPLGAASMEGMRQLRVKYMKLLGITDPSLAALPTILQRANLTGHERLLLEPIVLQLRQWTHYEQILHQVPVWVGTGLDRLNRLSRERNFTASLLRDRFTILLEMSQVATDDLQKELLGLQEIARQCEQHLETSFVRRQSAGTSGGDSFDFADAVADQSASPAANATWIDAVKQDIGDLVRSIENAEKMEPLSSAVAATGGAAATSAAANHHHLETVTVLQSPPDELGHSRFGGTRHIIDPRGNLFVLARPPSMATIAEDPRLLSELLLELGVAALAGLVARSLGFPSFLGYLCAGIALGPRLLDRVHNLVQISTLGQLALLIILLTLGLEVSFDKLRAVWRASLLITTGLTAGSVLLSCLVGGYLLRIPSSQSVLAGLTLSLSSTVIALKCLQGYRQRHGSALLSERIASLIMGVLLMQDVLFCLLLALLPALDSGTGDGGRWTLVLAKGGLLILKIAAFCAAVVGAVVVARRVGGGRSHRRLPIPGHVQVLTLALIASAAAHLCGISAELAVFIAAAAIGSLSDEGPEATERRAGKLAGLYEVAMMLFFSSIGLIVDARFLWGEKWLLLPLALIALLLKCLLVAVVARVAGGLTMHVSILVGLDLAQVSELALLLGARARQTHLITAECYYMLAGVTALSMVISPLGWTLLESLQHPPQQRQRWRPDRATGDPAAMGQVRV